MPIEPGINIKITLTYQPFGKFSFNEIQSVPKGRPLFEIPLDESGQHCEFPDNSVFMRLVLRRPTEIFVTS